MMPVVRIACRLPLVGLLVFSLTGFARLTHAQDTTGTGALVGAVTDADGMPEPFTTICLVATDRCIVTGEDGRFRLDGLRVGEYRLAITPPGRPEILSEAIEVRAGIERRVEVTAPRLDALESSVTVVGTTIAAMFTSTNAMRTIVSSNSMNRGLITMRPASTT